MIGNCLYHIFISLISLCFIFNITCIDRKFLTFPSFLVSCVWVCLISVSLMVYICGRFLSSLAAFREVLVSVVRVFSKLEIPSLKNDTSLRRLSISSFKEDILFSTFTVLRFCLFVTCLSSSSLMRWSMSWWMPLRYNFEDNILHILCRGNRFYHMPKVWKQLISYLGRPYDSWTF